MDEPRSSSRFLERKGYRLRRLRDAARALPIAGGVLWTIPLFWTSDETKSVSNASALIYIFGIWVLVILLTAFIARLLALGHDTEQDEGKT
jgi:hypothetical protein